MVRLRACHPLPVRLTRPSVAILVALSLAGCPGDAADDTATRCGLSLSALAEAQGLIPAPAVPGLPGAIVRTASDTAPGRDAVVVDPAPLLRGEHPGLRISLRAPSCTPEVEALPWVPTGPPASPMTRTIGDTTQLPNPLIGAVVITGDDSGAARDAAAWSRAFRDLRLVVTQHAAPTTDAARAAIGELCAGVDEDGSAIIVTSGRGTAARGGGLVLGAEAVTWSTLAGTIATRCDHLGVVIWVVDGAYAGDIDLGTFGALPVVLWRSSDSTAPDSARLSIAEAGQGGALSAVLAEVVRERLVASCLTRTRPRPAELAALFTEDGVRDRVLAARWEANRPSGTAPGIDLSALAEALAAQVPSNLQLTHREPPRALRCAGDSDCANLAAACELPGCHALFCVDRRCVAAVDAGASCDDGDSCTEADVCDAGGMCAGEVMVCDDGNPCTIEGCEPEVGCVTLPLGSAQACDDGDVCTDHDACDVSGECRGEAVDCDDGDPCTIDSCVPDVGCVSQVATLACDDGDPCTYSDACVQGVCTGTRLTCDDDNPCTADACDPETGACASRPVLEGTPCDDLDACTVADRCLGGLCGGLERACDDGLDCTFDTCDQGVCTHAPVPGTCRSGDQCVVVGQTPLNDPCVVCVATGVLAGQPSTEGVACAEDGVSCSIDACQGGVCRHVLPPGLCGTSSGGCVGVGDDVAPCLVCVETGVVAPRPAGSSCASGAQCMAGTCDAYGFCHESPVGCCPALPLACGDALDGGALTADSRVDAWSCLPGLPFPGAEKTWWFDAPCDGEVTFSSGYDAGTRVLLSAPNLAECGGGSCLEGGMDVTRTVTNGESLVVTLEAVSGLPWRLSVSCSCDDEGGAATP